MALGSFRVLLYSFPSLGGAISAPTWCYCFQKMLLEKPQHSIFLPDLVLSDLLPDHFPPWKQDIELESVRWLCKATRQFFALRKRRGCIVNYENQLLHQNELDDSKQANEWVCGVLKSAEAEARPRLFVELCVPLLHSLAFRGDADALNGVLRRLVDEFDEAVAHVQVPSGLWVRKSDVVRGLRVYEQVHLARNIRCTALRVLARHPILFGGMVYACAFALAFLRLRWMEKRTRMLMTIGVIPEFH